MSKIKQTQPVLNVLVAQAKTRVTQHKQWGANLVDGLTNTSVFSGTVDAGVHLGVKLHGSAIPNITTITSPSHKQPTTMELVTQN